MKTVKELKRNVIEAISFCDVNPELPASMKMSVISNISPDDQQISAPGSANDDDDSSWYNESAI